MLKRTIASLLLSLVATTSLAATNERTAELVGHYRAGIAAMQARDWAAYDEQMRLALEIEPGHPALERHVARACAMTGRFDEAFLWLGRAVESGADFSIEMDAYLDTLKSDARFDTLLARVQALKQPMGNGREAFALAEADFLPEGIAWDPGEDIFYLGSIRRRSIVRIHRDGSHENFVAPGADGLLGVLGLRVDEYRRELWAVTVAQPGMSGLSDANNGTCTVHRYSLESGELLNVYRLGKEDEEHNLNDIVIATDGRAYITDALSGALYTITPGKEMLEVLHGPGTFYAPNGLALSSDGNRLYVAQYSIGIAIMDTATLEADVLPHPASVHPVGIDGLYYDGGSLIGVQNFLGMQQVTRFRLAPGGSAITSAEILQRQHPRFEDPTTAAIANGTIFVVANSQLPKLSADGTVPSPDAFTATYIISIDLQP